MATISVSAEGVVAAPAERAYRILADYRRHHPRILPPAFSGFAVEAAGDGAGPNHPPPGVGPGGSAPAPAERAYRILADYRRHHPRILPPAFSGFAVEAGGVGAGTTIRFRVTAGGQARDYRQRVSEPAPGRVVREADLDG